MARGKQTCRILKEIRRQIAEANSIEFATSECRYKGDCPGTCPKCEAEVRYLERQLRARSLAGKAVTLAGISAGMILLSGCGGASSNQMTETLQGEPMAPVEQIEVTDTIKKVEAPIPEDTVIIEKDDNCLIDAVPGFVSDEPYSSVDKDAEFPGGMDALKEFLMSNLKYPEKWNEAHIDGKVIAQLEIGSNGKIGDVEIIQCTIPEEYAESAKEEVQRVIRLLPDFIPAHKNGEPVESHLILPIGFKLSDYTEDYDDYGTRNDKTASDSSTLAHSQATRLLPIE